MPSSGVPHGHAVLQGTPLGTVYLRQQIASGSTCTVFRALHPGPPAKFVAVKYITLPPASAPEDGNFKKLMREVKIHETLRHRNVLEMLGGEVREKEEGWPRGLFIVMKLASGGDLFDKIPPDRGLPTELAHLYFCQLLNGLKYLQSSGICHRDIKPENLLISSSGNLVITDFGLASVYKYKGKLRMLNDRCGSPPYAAPELAKPEPYNGEPIDVWSAGVVLFALLVGNTPWDEPTAASPEFAAYVEGEIWAYDPWNRIKGGVKVLLTSLLKVDPNRRITIAQLDQNSWINQTNRLQNPKNGQCLDGMLVGTLLATNLRNAGFLGPPEQVFEDLCGLMDETKLSSSEESAGMDVDGDDQDQPPPNIENRLPRASQHLLSQNKVSLEPSTGFQSSMRLYSRLSLAPSQRLNPHTTRFFSTLPIPILLRYLSAALTGLSVSHTLLSARDTPLDTTSLPPASSESYVPPSSKFTTTTPYFARFRFELRDSRKQQLVGSLNLSQGLLPATEEEEEKEGIDVVMYRKLGEPMAIKLLWKELTNRLDTGVIFAT